MNSDLKISSVDMPDKSGSKQIEDFVVGIISASQNNKVTEDQFILELRKFPSDLIYNNPENIKLIADSFLHSFKEIPLHKAIPLFDFLTGISTGTDSNGNLHLEAIRSGNRKITGYCLGKLLDEIKNGKIIVDEIFLSQIAAETPNRNSELNKKENLLIVSDILSFLKVKERKYHDDPVLYLYLYHKIYDLRVLAAKILDVSNRPVSEETAKKITGYDEYEILGKYLTFTCANHVDLLIITSQGNIGFLAETVKEAEKICGESLLKSVIGKLGWIRLNRGIFCEIKFSSEINGSYPFFVTEKESKFLGETLNSRTTGSVFVFSAFGGQLSDTVSGQSDSAVLLFKSYNLTHADVLRDILDIAPLTTERINAILSKMDKIVSEYIRLFSEYSDECSFLSEKYDELKSGIENELKNCGKDAKISAGLTRLVQMFEEPSGVKNVTTIHGLKRYLHQKGLKLGFKLVDKSRSPNRTADILLAENEKIISVLKNVRYADFEPDLSNENPVCPYPVKIVCDGFLRQLLQGNENFPQVDVFLYGNEIHYYAFFRNHPVFIRIDFSPPLQGGMIDLEYYAVSNYEIESHPNLNLDAIKYFFTKLEFDVQLNGTRIHARYDKERTVDFGLLCEKAAMLFCLLPYMMDLDWSIGSLILSDESRMKVTGAWAEIFLNWGSIPIKCILSEDKRNILIGTENHFDGKKEFFWNGEDDYRDSCKTMLPANFHHIIYSYFDEFGIELPAEMKSGSNSFGQLLLEKTVLNTLREGIECGEIIFNEEYFISAPAELFQRIHEAELFAEIISGDPEKLRQSIMMARLIAVFERTLSFTTTGFIENAEVQSARLPLLGKKLNVFVVRDVKGIIRLGIVSDGYGLFRHRKFLSDHWEFNGSFEMVALASLLRKNNYVLPFNEPSEDELENEFAHLTETFFESNISKAAHHFPDSITVYGLKASPGNTIAKALLGIESRNPTDFENCILFADKITPEDNTFIYHASGIVSTGGGVLSHAGLIAMQFGKPAVIINGNWITNPGGSKTLVCKTLEYKEETVRIKNLLVRLRKEIREKENSLNDGDIVILDGSRGSMTIIPVDKAGGIFDSLRKFSRAVSKLANTQEEGEILNLRGKVIKYRHALQKELSKISDGIIIRYAVYEILIGKALSGGDIPASEKSALLSIILNHKKFGGEAFNYITEFLKEIYSSISVEIDEFSEKIGRKEEFFELILLRLSLLKNVGFISSLFEIIPVESKIKKSELDSAIKNINRLFSLKLEDIRQKTAGNISRNINSGNILSFRHKLKLLKRIEELTGITGDQTQKLNSEFQSAEKENYELNKKNLIITPDCGGLELSPLIGMKAANLAEIYRLMEKKISPNWFAVTNKAFQQVMGMKVSPALLDMPGVSSGIDTLKNAIDAVVSNTGLTYPEQATVIRRIWDTILIPPEIVLLIADSYQNLLLEIEKDQNPENYEPYFAIRSSTNEEDTELNARAGEFETFLYIKGAGQIVEYLKKTWCGLWTERALHNRAVLNSGTDYSGGGVIVQQIVNSRIAGVLQTINVAKNDYGEILINVGLGLGQGIVSGLVAADQISVQKNEGVLSGNLKFNYIIGDKKEQVVFDSDSGRGTKITGTLYHQRFRAAMEYVELCELVKTAVELEKAYGYPLDIEFAFEGTNLWILQVRPVAVFLSAFQETITKYPLEIIKSEINK